MQGLVEAGGGGREAGIAGDTRSRTWVKEELAQGRVSRWKGREEDGGGGAEVGKGMGVRVGEAEWSGRGS